MSKSFIIFFSLAAETITSFFVFVVTFPYFISYSIIWPFGSQGGVQDKSTRVLYTASLVKTAGGPGSSKSKLKYRFNPLSSKSD